MTRGSEAPNDSGVRQARRHQDDPEIYARYAPAPHEVEMVNRAFASPSQSSPWQVGRTSEPSVERLP
jgi:hypothetical protein